MSACSTRGNAAGTALRTRSAMGRGLMTALACLCWAALPCWADSPEFEFHPPAVAGDPATPAVMRDLAERLLPVYQDPDADRYLANLSAIQLVAGSYSAADVSRESLRDRRRQTDPQRPIGRGLIYDIYAHAKAMESEDRVPFAKSFAISFHDAIARLNDQDAYVVTRWLGTAPGVFLDALQKSFNDLRGKDGLDQPEAVQLIWTYLAFDAYRSFGPIAGSLDSEDDRRRYATDADVTIRTRDGADLFAQVIRPKNAAKPLPTLLEFNIEESQNSAMESASRGYVGVVAHVRGTHGNRLDVVPYQHDGSDARAVIDWIARQSWSDGRGAMYGEGYGGYTPWAAAKHVPPALKAIATAAPTAPGVDYPMVGNVFRNSAFRWSLSYIDPKAAAANGLNDPATWLAFDQKWYKRGARYRDVGRLFGVPNPIFIRWLNHPSYDLYWQKMAPYEKDFAQINIPVLTITGYYAASEPGALHYFTQHLRYNPHADHTLLIGPYDDGALQHGPLPVLRGYPVDAAAVIDVRELRYQWFDHVLKGAATPSLLSGRVNYEVAGANEWRHAASLGEMSQGAIRYYLDTNAAGGRHTLTRQKPAKVRFIRQTVSYADRSDAGWTPAPDLVGKLPESRNGMIFMGPPLTSATDFNGEFSAHLDLTLNKMDVDLEIMLYERTAGGDYIRLFSPSYELRASYAADRVHRRLLKAGERQTLTFTSERPIGRRLRAGSRLVMVLGVGKRPDREINYGTGDDVSEESIADAQIPLKIRWYGDSYIDIPIRK